MKTGIRSPSLLISITTISASALIAVSAQSQMVPFGFWNKAMVAATPTPAPSLNLLTVAVANASGSYNVVTVDATTGVQNSNLTKQIGSSIDYHYTAAYNPSGTLLAVGGNSGGNGGTGAPLTILDTSTGNIVATPAGTTFGTAHLHQVRGLSFNKTGTMLAAGSQGYSDGGRVYSTSGWGVLATLTGPNTNGTAFNPSGTLLATATNAAPYIKVYNTSNWSTVTIPVAPPSATGAAQVAFNADGTVLAVTHDGGTGVTLYNTSTWAQITYGGASLPGGGRGVAFHPTNSSLIALGSASATSFRVYDMTVWGGALVGATCSGGVRTLSFNADGSRLAAACDSSGDPLYLYNTSNWSRITVSGLQGQGLGVALGP